MKNLTIAITGGDGSGKSTTCRRISELLTLENVPNSIVSVWDAINQSRSAFSTQSQAQAYLSDLDSVSRTFFIFHALSRSLNLAARNLSDLSSPGVILVEGYWYKYAVSELGYGADLDFVLGASKGFCHPDQVHFLEIAPNLALQRKINSQQTTDYERGGSGGDFVAFQSRLTQIWSDLEKLDSCRWRHWPGESSVDANAHGIAQQILIELKTLKSNAP